jgi:hypothetical protein
MLTPLEPIIVPEPPLPDRFCVELLKTGRSADGVERELGRAATILEAIEIYEREAARHPGRLVVMRYRIPEAFCPCVGAMASRSIW